MDKLEKLKDFIDEVIQQAIYHIEDSDHSQNLWVDRYNFCYDNLTCENGDKKHIEETIASLSMHTIENFLNYDIHYGISRLSEEVDSYAIGEIEIQIMNIYGEIGGHEVNCMFTALCKGLTSEEIEAVKSEYCFLNNFIYSNYFEYDRYSVTLDIDAFLEAYPNKEKILTPLFSA